MLKRRLPGVMFQTEAPPLGDLLPRMDIAAFAGLAGCGPVDLPVPVEDFPRFQEIFGTELPLAWDPEAGRMQNAYLSPTVEAFFRGGGRRCWVVRSALNPATSRYPLPGMASLENLVTGEFTPGSAPEWIYARSPGSGSDDLLVGTALNSLPLTCIAVTGEAGMTIYTGPDAPALLPGELLLLSLRSNELDSTPADSSQFIFSQVSDPQLLFLFVESAERRRFDIPVLGLRLAQRVRVRPAAWVSRRPFAGLQSAPDPLQLLIPDSTLNWPWEPLDSEQVWMGSLITLERLTFDLLAWRGQEITARAVALGFHPDHQRFWGNLPTDAQLFSLDLQVRGRNSPRSLFWESMAHPRCPFAGPPKLPGPGLPLGMFPYPERSAARPAQDAVLPDPLQLRAVPQRIPVYPESRLERDGLLSFSADLFLDPDLAKAGYGALLSEAERKHYILDQPLHGLHSLFPIEEVSLVSVPDAVQRGWKEVQIDPPDVLGAPHLTLTPLAEEINPFDEPHPVGDLFLLEWTPPGINLEYILEESSTPDFILTQRLLQGPQRDLKLRRESDCPVRFFYRVRAMQGTRNGPWSNTVQARVTAEDFEGCVIVDLPAPELAPVTSGSLDKVLLRWNSVQFATGYCLEKSVDPLSETAETIYTGEETTFAGLPEVSLVYYRVRAELYHESDWSASCRVRWTVSPPEAMFDQATALSSLAAELDTPRWETIMPECPSAEDAAASFAPEPETGLLLTWKPVLGASEYTVQVSADPVFNTASVLYQGPAHSVRVTPPPFSTAFYRVRASFSTSSPWSITRLYRPGGQVVVQQIPAVTYNSQDLLAVQNALLRMCAARGDLLAILGMPSHFQMEHITAHLTALRPGDGEDDPAFLGSGKVKVAPLTYGEIDVLSYGAMYHPWMYTRRDALVGQSGPDRANGFGQVGQGVRILPPEGDICGMFARRALERGAWVAPANQPLQSVVALEPPFTHGGWEALLDLQVNLIVQDPRGFMTLSADTLSEDALLRPVNVRRLLILLRRLALREGMGFVFQPHNQAFQNMVQHHYELMLAQLYTRGAFAGSTPREAYQVDSGPSVNPPESVDRGRFIVELRVAPSQPLAFITVRLVQTDRTGLTVQEV